jgi:excinuclease ABC subunit B
MAKESFASCRKIKGYPRSGIVEQLVRPTGIPDPKIEIKPVSGQISDVIEEIEKESILGRRTLVTTLTKKTAEDLTTYLKEKGLKVHYLHSDIATLERTDILDDLRKGKYDCLIGVNLLREGLDLPEVSLVVILDADKEGFLRSEVSLIQTMGRAARHVDGRVILYADTITKSIRNAISEVKRRRNYQLKYNKINKIHPQSISKPLREKIIENEIESEYESIFNNNLNVYSNISDLDTDSLTPLDKRKLIINLKREMRISASDLNFELAARIRDKIISLES